MNHLVAPSVLAADFLHLGRDMEMLEKSATDWIHFDVMDGRFVPNISFGFPVLQAVKRVTTKPLDVHLMIEQPEQYLESFKNAGADRLTIHAEAVRHLDRTLNEIRRMGMAPGIALNPATPWESVRHVLPLIDTLLIMTVNPGFGGQSFITYTLDKIRTLRAWMDSKGLDVHIQVDGGIDLKTKALVLEAGADVLVSGSAVFSSKDPMAYIAALKEPG